MITDGTTYSCVIFNPENELPKKMEYIISKQKLQRDVLKQNYCETQRSQYKLDSTKFSVKP